MATQLTIIDAILDEALFQPFLGDLDSWRNWRTSLRVMFGQPVKSNRSRKLITECTGRNPETLPGDGFRTSLLLVGRRSGKSRTAAVIGAYEAALAGHESKLAKGERGLVPIICPTKSQGRIIKGYLRAIFETPLLAAEVTDEQALGFTLRSGTRIEILAGDHKSSRGFTMLAAIVDEIAFFGVDEDSKVRSDTELIRAIKPALATTGGKLICVGSPYARKGWSWNTYRRHYGNDASTTLVWNCSSRTMNPTLPQSVVDDAMGEDLAAARSEYLGEFRDDVGVFLPREVIERLVKPGRKELLPRDGVKYFAFADLSGGRSDDAALAVAHREGRTIVLDLLAYWRSPFNPTDVVTGMADELRTFGVRRLTGDNYAGEWVSSAFLRHGIQYTKCDLAKSGLYAEWLAVACSGGIELLDDDTLVSQFASLERRTRSGGKDVIDHPSGHGRHHDDLANAVAGVSYITSTKRVSAGWAGF